MGHQKRATQYRDFLLTSQIMDSHQNKKETRLAGKKRVIEDDSEFLDKTKLADEQGGKVANVITPKKKDFARDETVDDRGAEFFEGNTSNSNIFEDFVPVDSNGTLPETIHAANGNIVNNNIRNIINEDIVFWANYFSDNNSDCLLLDANLATEWSRFDDPYQTSKRRILGSFDSSTPLRIIKGTYRAISHQHAQLLMTHRTFGKACAT